jgi:hypothetical protein
MQQPTENADILFEEIIQDFPPETEKLAREFKAFTRGRKVKNVKQLLRIVLSYCGLDKAMRNIAGEFTMLYKVKITDQSIMERLVAAQAWVKALLPKMLGKPKLPIGKRVSVVDASDIREPGSKNWYRLHLSIDLATLEILQIKITDKYSGESLNNFQFQNSEIVINDRGYCHAQAMVEQAQQGVDLISRVHPHNLPLFDLEGKRINLVEKLSQQEEQTICTMAVKIRDKAGEKEVLGFIHAYRLGAQEAEKARRKCLNKRRKHQTKNPDPAALFLAGFVIIFTTISPDDVAGEIILSTYRCRWQVELVFKRWKSLLNVDLLRAKVNNPLGNLWMHGKLLYALMIERRINRIFGSAINDLTEARKTTGWSVYQAMVEQVSPLISGVAFWHVEAWPDFLKVTAQRSRKRALQNLSQDFLFFLKSDKKVLQAAA